MWNDRRTDIDGVNMQPDFVKRIFGRAGEEVMALHNKIDMAVLEELEALRADVARLSTELGQIHNRPISCATERRKHRTGATDGQESPVPPGWPQSLLVTSPGLLLS